MWGEVGTHRCRAKQKSRTQATELDPNRPILGCRMQFGPDDDDPLMHSNASQVRFVKDGYHRHSAECVTTETRTKGLSQISDDQRSMYIHTCCVSGDNVETETQN